MARLLPDVLTTHPLILQHLFGALGDRDLRSCVRMLTNLQATNGSSSVDVTKYLASLPF